MPEVISDVRDPRVRDYVGLTDMALRRRYEPEGGLFLAESEKVIRRALAAGFRPRSYLMGERWLTDLADLVLAAEADGIPVFTGPAATIERWQTYQYGSPWLPKKQPICGSCGYWHNFAPFNFYAAWKYAQVIGNNDPNVAKSLFDAMSAKVESPPADAWLINKPYFINLYAAGYLGYLQLKQLADLGGDTTVQDYYDHMLTLRVNNFAKDTPYWGDQPTNIGNINYPEEARRRGLSGPPTVPT